MKSGSTLFLRLAIAAIALGVVAICLFIIPQIIATFQWGGFDPILVGLYVPAVPFFFALYQSIKLLDLIDKNQAFSLGSIDAFRKIKYSALIIAGLFGAAMPYIFYAADRDDAPGAVLVGVVITGASLAIATFSGLLQRLVQNAVDIKSENDLTV